jgi:hypothetical protein
VGGKKIACKILVAEHETKNHFGERVTDGRIIWKLIIKKYTLEVG